MLSEAPKTLSIAITWNGDLIAMERGVPGSTLRTPHGDVDVAEGRSEVGSLVVVASDVAAAAPVRDRRVDVAWWRTASLALILVLGLISAMKLTSIVPGIPDDVLTHQRMKVQAVVMRPIDRPKEQQQKPKAQKREEWRYSLKPAESSAPTTATKRFIAKRTRDREEALAALKMLNMEAHAAANVFAPGVGNSNVQVALHQLSRAGTASNGGGLGTRDTGAGNGGRNIGIGDVGSGSSHRGPGDGPTLDGNARGHIRAVIADERNIKHEHGLHREEIQRVINRALSRIRYCYEQELQKDPNLEGKLTSHFVIAASGDVASASALQSTLNGTVDGCVARVLRSLKFPAPRGGGTVAVTYPFVFTAK